MNNYLANLDQWQVFFQAILVAFLSAVIPSILAWRASTSVARAARDKDREEVVHRRVDTYYQDIRNELDGVHERMQAVEAEAEDQRSYIRELEDHVYELRTLIKGLSPTTTLPPVPQRRRRQPPTK